MELRVVFRPSAQDDLTAIALYIAGESGVDRALAYVDRIEGRCLDLARFPRAGRDRGRIKAGLRTVAFEKRVVIVYLIGAEGIEIVRVAYGGRNIDALLKSMG